MPNHYATDIGPRCLSHTGRLADRESEGLWLYTAATYQYAGEPPQISIIARCQTCHHTEHFSVPESLGNKAKDYRKAHEHFRSTSTQIKG